MSTYNRDGQAIAAIGEELGAPGPAGRLGALLAEQETAARPPAPDLSPAQLKHRTDFEHDSDVLASRVLDEVRALDTGLRHGATEFGRTLQVRGGIEAVLDTTFTPAGLGNPWPYQLSWRQVDGFEATGDGAGADIQSGTFWASRYSVGGQLNAYAGLGAWITPEFQSCRLWVRPYVNWSGFDILQHRVFDPSVHEQRWAVAQVQLGIFVQSWYLAGGSFNTDATKWITLWNRSELNPVGSRNYQGTAFAGDYTLEAFGTSSRQYAIWATCRATAIAESGFAVATRASASVSCNMPAMLVGQIH